MIANPAYKGEWSPRRIANPDYFVDENPGRIPAVKGVMFEVMINTGMAAFDNVLVARDEAVVAEFAKLSWLVEKTMQETAAKLERRTRAKEERLKLLDEGGYYNLAMFYLGEASEFVEDNFILTVALGITMVAASAYMCCTGIDDPEFGPEEDLPEDEADAPEAQGVGEGLLERKVERAPTSDDSHADDEGDE